MKQVTSKSKSFSNFREDPRARNLAELDDEIVKRLSPFAQAVVKLCREEGDTGG